MPLYCLHSGSPDKVFIFPEDTADGGTPSGTDVSEFELPSNLTSPAGAVIHDGHLIVADDTGDEVFWFPLALSGSTLAPSKRISLPPGNSEIDAITVVGGQLVVADGADSRLYFYPLDTVNGATAVETKYIFPRAFSFYKLAAVGNDIYVSSDDDDRIRVISATTAHEQIADTARTIILPSTIGRPSGIAINGNDLYLSDSDDDKIYLINADTANNTTAAVRRSFNLPLGLSNPQGLAFEAGAITVEITTADTEIRGGEVVDFAIAFSGSVTGFSASDVSVTGGTAGNLTGSGANYVLSVTAATGSGSIVLSIDADAVSPGNASVSASFTRTARPTATVTFDPTAVRGGRVTEATIDWSENVTGFSLADVSVDVGALSNFSGSGASYTVDVTAPSSGSGTIVLTVAADAVDDGNAEATGSVGYSPLPTVDISINKAKLIPGRNATATLEFSESVTGLTLADLSVDVGALSDFSGSGATWSVRLTAPSSGTGTMTLTVGEDAVDAGLAVTAASVPYEPFSLSWSNLPTGTVNTSFRAQLDFSHAIINLDAADILLRRGAGSDSNPEFYTLQDSEVTITQIPDTTNYTLDIELSGTYAAEYLLRLRANAVRSSGLTFPASTLDTAVFTIDSDHGLPVTPTINFDVSSVRGGRVATATIAWSESVDDFDISDLSVDVGTLSNFSGSGDTYTVDVTAPPTGSGTITLTIAADAVSAGNVEVTGSVSYSPLPTATVSFDPDPLRTGRKTLATVVWSESVTGFTAADVSVDVGTINRVLGSGTTRTVEITAPPTGSGTLTLTIREDAVNEKNAALTSTVAYQPLPTIAVSFDPDGVRNGRVTEATLVWSEDVTGFSLADVSVDVGSLSNFSGSGDTYSVDVTAPSMGSGDITLTVREDAVDEGNAEATAGVAHSPLPTLTIAFDKAKAIVGRNAEATLTFSESVTGLTTADVSVDVGSVDSVSGSGTTWTVELSAPSSGTGTMTLTVALDAVDQGLAVTEGSVAYSPFSVGWSNVPMSAVNNNFRGQLDFSHPISGLTGSDLLLRRISGDDSNGNFTNLTDSQVTVTQIAGTNNYTLDFELSGTYDGVYQVRLRPNRLQSDGANYPSSAVNTANITIDTNLGVVVLASATISFSETSVRGGRTTQATIEWSESVDDFAVGDLSVNVGALSDFSGSGTTYTVDVTAPETGSGTLTLTLAASSVAAGNMEVTGSVTYSPLPTVAVTFDSMAVRGGRVTEATVVWSESVTGFSLADVSVDVGVLSDFSGSGTTYTVDVTAPETGSGTLTLTVREDAVNEGNDATTGSVAYQPLPTVAITFDSMEVRGGRVSEATLVFSESVMGINLADVSVDVGTLSNFAGSGDTYTVDVTAPLTGSGSIVLTVREDAAVEGNAVARGSVAYQPLATVAIVFDTAVVRNGRVTEATLTFSESVSGLAIGDLSVDFGTLSNFAGSGDTYTVDVTAPASGSGTITLAVALDAANEGLDATTGGVAYQPLPTVAITFDADAVRHDRVVAAMLVFSESVTDFTLSDVSVDVGALSNFSGSGDSYSVDVTAPSSGTGTLTLSVAADAVNAGNLAVSAGIAYLALPTVAITFGVTEVVAGQSVVANIDWSESVDGFTASDVMVTGTGATVLGLSGSGDAYALTIQTAVAGTGTIRVQVGRDAVDVGNAVAVGTIDYAIPGTLEVEIIGGYTLRYVVLLAADDPVDLNDFRIGFRWERAVDGFDVDDVDVTGATLQSFEQLNERYWEMVVRPPDRGSGGVTVSVGSGAITEGNRPKTETFRYTSSVATEVLFDWDAAIPNVLQGDSSGQYYGPIAGIVVEGDRIRLMTEADGALKIFMLRHDGTRVSSGDEVVNTTGASVYLGFIYERHIAVSLSLINDRWFASAHNQDNSAFRRDYFRTMWSYRGSGVWREFVPEDFGIATTDFGISGATQGKPAAHSTDINRWGLFFPSQNGRVYAQNFAGEAQRISGLVAGTEGGSSTPMVAVGDRVYVENLAFRAVGSGAAVPLVDETLRISKSVSSDYAVYGKWLYYTHGTVIRRVDLEKYRPPVVRSPIVPQWVVEGERIDLKPFASGVDRIIFDGAYDPPEYLSIDGNMNLVVDAGVVAADTCLLVKLRAFSFRGEVPFGFYLVIMKKEPPVWKDVKVLPVDNGETVNLFEFVENAKRIAWKSGFRVPSGWSLSNGQLTVANQTSESPVVAELTAFNDEGGRDISFLVRVRIPGGITTSELYDYRVLIDGIDVSVDLLEIASIHHSLDVINPNEFVSDDASFVLSSDAGKYDGRVSGNFWDQNGLNENGYLAKVEIWVDILDDPDNVQSKMLFQGLIIEVQSSINGVEAVVNCVDQTYVLKNTAVTDFGLEKYSAVHRVRETYEGVYAPDGGLLPILRESASVVAGFDDVPVEGFQNVPESVGNELACFVSENAVLTRGGYFSDDPLLKFRTGYQRRALGFLIKRLSEASGYFNTKVEIRPAMLPTGKHITSRGNVELNVEPTKPTRTVVDWVHDGTNDVFYLLLSHPSGYVRDSLVSYAPEVDGYETLRTFAAGVQVVQLASSDYDTFYVLATTASDFDRIESVAPSNYTGAVTDNWDSSRETGATRILRYVVSTGRETVHVGAADAYPPQVGVHYMAGFENERHIRWREGIFSESRSRFVVHNNALYYRYATWERFGVAKVDASGSTSAVMSADRDVYFNMLNFAFDVAANGDVYFVYSEGMQGASGLRIRKYDGTTETDLVKLRLDLASLTVLDGRGGAYLGCYEVLFANGRLFCVVPVQRVSVDGAGTVLRDIKRSAGAVLYGVSSDGFDVEVLKTYDYVQRSCRSLTLHEGEVYFAEYANASTHYAPSNPDLADWDAGRRSNAVPPNKRWLYRVRGSGVEAVVSPWYEGQAFNATAVGMLSDGSRLHAIVRYADKFGISGVDADAADSENEQWVTFGEDIPFYVERFGLGSLHSALVGYAKLGNARLEMVGNRFRFSDVDPYEALCASAVSASAGRLNYEGANKAFPQSGYVLVDGEIMKYTGRGPRQLTGLSRGMDGTAAVVHTAGSRVLFINKVVHRAWLFDEPLKDINIRIDTNKFYNVVRDSENTAAAVDRESVDRFGVREYVTDLALSDHQIAWRRYINAKTLNRLKDIKSVVRFRMRAAYYLDIGDVVAFRYGEELLMPIQIIDIQHRQGGGENSETETHIIGQEVKALPRVGFGGATVADKTFKQYEPIVPFTLPAAADPRSSYVYRLEGLGAGLRFDAETRTVSGTPEDVHTSKLATYIVYDRENPTVTARLTFAVTVSETTLRFADRQSDLALGVGVAVSETLAGATGGTGMLRYALSGTLAAGVTFDGANHRLTGTPTELHGRRDYRYGVQDDRGVSRQQTFSIETVRVNRFMVVQSHTLTQQIYALDFDGNRVSSEDLSAEDVPGLFGPRVVQPSIVVVGASASPRRIAMLRMPAHPTETTPVPEVFIYDRSWHRLLAEETTLARGIEWEGLAWLPGYWLLLDNTNKRIVFYDTDWVEQTGRQIDLPTGDWVGLAVTATRIHPLDNAGNSLHSYTYAGAAMAGERVALGSGTWEGATSTPSGVVVMEVDGNNTDSFLRLYDNDLTRTGSISLNGLGGNLFYMFAVLALNPTGFLE